MAQNEMKAMRGMPLRVPSMEGLAPTAQSRDLDASRLGDDLRMARMKLTSCL